MLIKKQIKNRQALLAQLVEQLPLKEMVGGSNPPRGTEIKSWVLYPVFYFGRRVRSPIDPEPFFRLNYVINEKRDTFWSLKIIYYLYKNRLGTIGVLNL